MKSPVVATVSGHVFTYPTVTALSAAGPLPPRSSSAVAPSAAVAPHVAFAFGFLPMDVLAMSLRHATVVCGAAGAWLLVSPWALGYGAIAAAAAAAGVLLGAALVAVSGGARGEERSLR